MDSWKSLEFSLNLEPLLDSPQSSDFEILVENKIIKTHKLVLMTRNQVLSKMIKTNKTTSIAISDVDAKSFMLFLNYLYTNKFNEDDVSPNLLLIAHKYEDKKLTIFCEKYLLKNVTQENAIEVLLAAIECGSQKLKTIASDQLANMNKLDLLKSPKLQLLCQNEKSANIVFQYLRDEFDCFKKEFCSVSRTVLFDISEMAIDEIRYSKLFCAANIPWRLYITRRFSERDGTDVLLAGLIFEGDEILSCCAYFSMKLIPFQSHSLVYNSAYQIKEFSEENNVQEVLNCRIFWAHIMSPAYVNNNCISLNIDLSLN